MVNLLPPSAKKKYVFEYYARALAVLLFLLTAAGFVLGALMVPLWVSIEIQGTAIANDYEVAVAGTESYTGLEDDITRANTIATELDRVSGYEPLLPYLTEVEARANPAISIASVSIARDARQQVQSMVVTGEAGTRASLAEYRDSLEASPSFTSAELPISNLAKDRDVPFSISVTIAQPQ